MKKKRSNIETKGAIKILIYTILFFSLMYVLTAIITGEINFRKDNNEDIIQPVVIQYDEILAGETFTRPEAKYYVIFYKFNISVATAIKTTIDNYNQEAKSLKVYSVDLSNYFNKTIYDAKNKNINTSNITNLRISNSTLIKVENSENILVVEGDSAIIKYFAK